MSLFAEAGSQSFAEHLSAELQRRDVLGKVATAFQQRGMHLGDLEGISEKDLRDLCNEFHFDVVGRVLITKSIADATKAAEQARVLRQQEDQEDDFVLISFGEDFAPDGAPGVASAAKPTASPRGKSPKPKAKAKAKAKKSPRTPRASKSPRSPRSRQRKAAKSPKSAKPPTPRGLTRAQRPTKPCPLPPPKATQQRAVAGAPAQETSRPNSPPRQRRAPTVAQAICAKFDRTHQLSIATFADFLQTKMTQATYDRMWAQVDDRKRGFLPRPQLIQLLVFAYMVMYAYYHTKEDTTENGPALRRALQEDLQPVQTWISAHELRARPTFNKQDFMQAGRWVARLANRA